MSAEAAEDQQLFVGIRIIANIKVIRALLRIVFKLPPQNWNLVFGPVVCGQWRKEVI